MFVCVCVCVCKILFHSILYTHTLFRKYNVYIHRSQTIKKYFIVFRIYTHIEYIMCAYIYIKSLHNGYT